MNHRAEERTPNSKIVNDYDKQKEKHLEKLATKIINGKAKINRQSTEPLSRLSRSTTTWVTICLLMRGSYPEVFKEQVNIDLIQNLILIGRQDIFYIQVLVSSVM